MPSATLGNVLSKVYSRLDNNTALYPRLDVVEEINDAIKTVNLLTGEIQDTVQILTKVVNPGDSPQLVYDVPAPFIYLTAVLYEGRELAPNSLLMLASQYRSWATDVSYPGGRPVREWAPIGFTKFVIHPMDGSGGRSLLLTGVVEPPLVVNDGDKIPVPNEYVEDIEDLVGSVLPVREGGRAFGAAGLLYRSFIRKMKTKTAFTNLKWPQYYERVAGRKPYAPKTAQVQPL